MHANIGNAGFQPAVFPSATTDLYPRSLSRTRAFLQHRQHPSTDKKRRQDAGATFLDRSSFILETHSNSSPL
jgi:hypothetical protein